MSPSDEEWVDALQHVLTGLVRDVQQTQLFERMREVSGIEISQHLLLVFARIGEMSPVRIAELAKTMEVDRSTISRQVAELESGGFVHKEVDQWDRRSVVVSVTSSGEVALDKIWGSWRETLDEATAHWSATDRRRFLVLARNLHQGIENFIWQGAPRR
jgi:DNA-binding MarR family transcriptional regulator